MSVVLTLSYRDSEPGGGICADDAEAKAEAAKVAREVLADLADPDELDDAFTDAENSTPDRAGVFSVADLTDDEALETAANLLAFEWGTLPGEPAPSGPSAEAALELGVVLARRVVANWSAGDLAAAVNALEEWADEVAGDFPALDFADDDEESDDDDATPAPKEWESVERAPGEWIVTRNGARHGGMGPWATKEEADKALGFSAWIAAGGSAD